jgi:enoyl-CoA hydratase/carnithine racemase
MSSALEAGEDGQLGSVRSFQEGGLVSVTLDHPGKLNAMSRSMWRGLKGVFQDIQADAGARCVLIRGATGNFCAGGDIAEYPAFRFSPESLRAFHEDEVWAALQALLDCDVPIVAQIEGHCMGAGLEIASCCDIRIAGVSSRFGAPIARLGFPMAPREAALVAATLGSTTARAMLLAAEVLDAPQLQASGFLTRAVADAQVVEVALEMALRITRLAPTAARLNKRTLRELNRAPAPVEPAHQATNVIANRPSAAVDPFGYAASAEHLEGISAFLEKRQPRF